jgi:hypothetical protein
VDLFSAKIAKSPLCSHAHAKKDINNFSIEKAATKNTPQLFKKCGAF